MVKLCEFSLNQKWKLIYRASRDGFEAFDFHTKCDEVANSLVVIKSTSGNIFGGFASEKWSSSRETIKDAAAFIFSLKNKENNPFKAVCSNGGENALVCDSRTGPTFGGKRSMIRDLIIRNNSNKHLSCSNFGHVFKHTDYEMDSDKAKNILAGTEHFLTKEIEIFCLID